MSEKYELPTNADAKPEQNGTGAGSVDNLHPRLMPDGTHNYPVVNVSIPAHGVNGNGTGEVTWHPEKGLQFRIEATSTLEAALGGFRQTSRPAASAGEIREPSCDAQLVGKIAGTGDTIQLFELAANTRSQSQSGTADFSMKTIVSGTAVAATVRIERDSKLSFWHETIGDRRLLIPDLWMHQWLNEDKAEWKSDGTYYSSARFSCPLSDSPNLTLFSASKLPHDRYACWLAFDALLIPEGERNWYTPDACVAARSLLSFLTGKRLPFLWLDHFLDESHLTRTYFGTAKVDDFRHEDQGYQPVPFRSLQHGLSVVAVLPSLFTSYLSLRKWIDLDWVAGPLWYAATAYLDDKLGLATVSLERFGTAHSSYLEANPDKKRPRIRFLSKEQFKSLKKELLASIESFATEKSIDLAQNRFPIVSSIIDKTVDEIAKLDDSLFPSELLGDLRMRMNEALRIAGEANKLQLDDTKKKIIENRLNSFAEKTNPDKLIESIEYDGLAVSDLELEAIKKRNDCLHGRRTLLDATNLTEIMEEMARFDTLRTLINKALLARLGYLGLYVDYAARPPQGQFPVKNLADELTPTVADE
jgi:hypothetical protein